LYSNKIERHGRLQTRSQPARSDKKNRISRVRKLSRLKGILKPNSRSTNGQRADTRWAAIKRNVLGVLITGEVLMGIPANVT
jgi:hypothetical protein